MPNAELTVMLFAFRHAVHRIGTQSLSAIQSELVTNLHRFPDWMLAQMERDLEWNFELMEMRRDGDGKVKFDDDCEFQRPFLEAVKEQRRKLKEDNKCQQ